MANILLVTDAGDDARELAAALQSRKHRVTIVAKRDRLPVRGLERVAQEFDVLVVDVSRAAPEDLSILRDTHNQYASRPRPGAVFFSTRHRGAVFELQVERAGARYVRVR